MTSAALPTSAKASRLRAFRTHAGERASRLSFYALRDRYTAGQQVAASAIGFAVMNLWTAEALHRESMARYQETLALREALPADERWSEKELCDWLSAAVKAPPLKDRNTPSP